MPLAFESRSHGTIAFGYFNIESDMLLCDRLFFFASDFCAKIIDVTANDSEPIYQSSWEVQRIANAEDIGDLMGAIHGVQYTGFIGELYRCFPFPQQPQDFKQNPDGDQTRSQVEKIISKYAREIEIKFAVDHQKLEAALGPYCFDRSQFQELLKYVWRGGYPCWKNEIRPAYVADMENQIMANPFGIFEHIEFLD